MNAEQLDLPENSCDAVISRLGLMLIGRKQQALREIRRVLKPGGRLAALVWSKPERNPLFARYVDILANSLRPEELQEPLSDPFSLADAAVFARALTEAGFRDVQVQATLLTFHFPSFDVLRAWWGPDYDEALAKLEGERRQRMQEEVRQAVRQFEGSQGIVAPAELLLGVLVCRELRVSSADLRADPYGAASIPQADRHPEVYLRDRWHRKRHQPGKGSRRSQRCHHNRWRTYRAAMSTGRACR
jgi:SAM-dependent methyltransferase